MTATGAWPTFAALLDRSVARIGELVADGRYVDREEIARIADVWDNNTFPLFGVAVARPRWMREQRARTALEWMASLGGSRREWMIDQGCALGPAAVEPTHRRDYRGHVRPVVAPLNPMTLDQDYHLGGAELRAMRVERAGTRLSGYVAVAVPRRYSAPEASREAILRVLLSDVRTANFDSSDSATVSLSADAVQIGVRGGIRAVSASVDVDDDSWHLSRAGRAADADTPFGHAGRAEPPPSIGRLSGVGDTAHVLHRAMLTIRMVRYAEMVGRIPLRELCDALEGAGTKVLTAADRPRRSRGGAFRRLTAEWTDASPTRPAAPPPPDLAQLTFAGYDTVGGASAVINVAVPEDDGRWSLRSAKFEQAAHLTLTTDAFTEAHAVARDDFSLGDSFRVRR